MQITSLKQDIDTKKDSISSAQKELDALRKSHLQSNRAHSSESNSSTGSKAARVVLQSNLDCMDMGGFNSGNVRSSLPLICGVFMCICAHTSIFAYISRHVHYID